MLFERDRTVISRHIANVYKEEEADKTTTGAKFARVQVEGSREVLRSYDLYNLDIVISVGYRVKSQRGVEFRCWATGVLRKYIVEGHAENQRRLAQLGQIVQVMERVPESLEAKDILSVVKAYTSSLNLLDDYDHQCIAKPKGSTATYVLDTASAAN